jgi:electron transfer flavoprotein beta subunit
VEDDGLASADAFVSSAALASAMKDESFDLVLTGLQSDDQGHGQMGVVLAERLDMAHSTIIMEVKILDGSAVRVNRELEGGWFQRIVIPLPAVLTIQSGINQLRYATLKGIMSAKNREIKRVPLPPGIQPSQQIISLSLPARSKQTQMIGGAPETAAAELVRRLREEARVL